MKRFLGYITVVHPVFSSTGLKESPPHISYSIGEVQTSVSYTSIQTGLLELPRGLKDVAPSVQLQKGPSMSNVVMFRCLECVQIGFPYQPR